MQAGHLRLIFFAVSLGQQRLCPEPSSFFPRPQPTFGALPALFLARQPRLPRVAPCSRRTQPKTKGRASLADTIFTGWRPSTQSAGDTPRQGLGDRVRGMTRCCSGPTEGRAACQSKPSPELQSTRRVSTPAAHPPPCPDHLPPAGSLGQRHTKGSASCWWLLITRSSCGLPLCPSVHPVPPSQTGNAMGGAGVVRCIDVGPLWPAAESYVPHLDSLPRDGASSKCQPGNRSGAASPPNIAAFLPEEGRRCRARLLTAPQTSSYSSGEPHTKYRSK